MKKLFILACLLFLFSCTTVSDVPVNCSVFVTGASPKPRSESFARKFESYDQYMEALDTEFNMPAVFRVYDGTFFDSQDLIVVILEVSGSLNQQMFRLESVHEKGGSIIVQLRVTYPKDVYHRQLSR